MRIPWFYIGIGVISIAIVVSVVWFLRTRDVGQAPSLAPISSSVPRPTTVGATTTRDEYTPAEIKERDTLTDFIRRMPTSVSDTWPPELRQ